MNKGAQDKLQQAHVLILGVGAVGSVSAAYLAAAGVGHLSLVDPGKVKAANLSSNIMLRTDDVGARKVTTIAQQLREINPSIEIIEKTDHFTTHNAEVLLQGQDLVMDGLDGWQDKLTLSDACMQLNVPLVHAGMTGFDLHLFLMIPGRSACLRCVFSKIGLEDLPPTDPHPGVLGPLAGMAGAFQATEALKFLSGMGISAGNHLIKFDALRRNFDDVRNLGPSRDCPDCRRRRAV